MLIEKDNARRLLVFFFYDKDGIADDYIFYMLDDMQKNVTDIRFVVNGLIQEETLQRFKKYSQDVLVRNNKGFDVWACKEALEDAGWDNLKKYDEVIWMNFTLMGPLYPLKEVFDTMAEKDLDYWGMTVNHGVNFNPFASGVYDFLPPYLPTNFLVMRRTLVESPAFLEYWQNMHEIKSVDDSISYHESVFTKHFEDLGFKWDVFCDTRDILDHSNYPMIREPILLLRDYHCPVVKRKTFFYEYENLLSNSNGDQASRVMQYLRDYTDYDTKLIWQNMLRTQNLADLRRVMHLNYVLNTEYCPDKTAAHPSVALVSHQYYEDLFAEGYQYAANLPEYCDVYITTDTEEKKAALEKLYSQRAWGKLQVLVVENRGRNMGALLTNLKGKLSNYDLICVVHGLKSSRYKRTVKGRTAFRECMENLLASPAFIQNILNTFEREELLGMLVPPPAIFGDYYKNLGNECGKRFHIVKNLAKRFHVTVDINKDKEPVAPMEGMFWIRGNILNRLFDIKWNPKDFTAEDQGIRGGSLQESVPLFLPFLAQSMNYYTAWSVSDRFATVEIDNLYHMIRELNIAVFKRCGTAIHRETLSRINSRKWNKVNKPEENISFIRKVGRKVKPLVPVGLYEKIKSIYFKRYEE